MYILYTSNEAISYAKRAHNSKIQNVPLNQTLFFFCLTFVIIPMKLNNDLFSLEYNFAVRILYNMP